MLTDSSVTSEVSGDAAHCLRHGVTERSGGGWRLTQCCHASPLLTRDHLLHFPSLETQSCQVYFLKGVTLRIQAPCLHLNTHCSRSQPCVMSQTAGELSGRVDFPVVPPTIGRPRRNPHPVTAAPARMESPPERSQRELTGLGFHLAPNTDPGASPPTPNTTTPIPIPSVPLPR